MLHVQFWYLSSISGTKWQCNEESVTSHSFLSLIRLVGLLEDRYSRVWIKCLDDYHHSTLVMNQTRAMLQIHVPLNPVGLLHFFYIRSGIHKPWEEKEPVFIAPTYKRLKTFIILPLIKTLQIPPHHYTSKAPIHDQHKNLDWCLNFIPDQKHCYWVKYLYIQGTVFQRADKVIQQINHYPAHVKKKYCATTL